MEEDDEPEGEFVAGLFGFVADVALGEEGRRPAAEEFEEMKLGFGNSPTASFGAVFVVRVGEPGDGRDGEDVTDGVAEVRRVLNDGIGREDQKKAKDGAKTKTQFAVRSFLAEGGVDGTGASFAIVADAKGNKIANARKTIAFQEIADMQEKTAAVVLEEAITFINIPFDDAGTFFL